MRKKNLLKKIEDRMKDRKSQQSTLRINRFQD